MTNTTTPGTTPAHPVTPEKRLMAAVLNDALDVVGAPGGRHRRKLVRATYAWFASDDTEWPFSFRNICAVLGIDPFALREVVGRHAHGRVAYQRLAA
jgi:hypothetical protein